MRIRGTFVFLQDFCYFSNCFIRDAAIGVKNRGKQRLRFYIVWVKMQSEIKWGSNHNWGSK